MTKPVRAAVRVDLDIEGLRAELAPDTARCELVLGFSHEPVWLFVTNHTEEAP